MVDIVSVRLEEVFLEKIDSYAKSKGKNRAEAMRHLMELGLKLDEIQDDRSSLVEEEFQKLQLELFIRTTQIFFMNNELDSEEFKQKSKAFAKLPRRRIKENYPHIFEKFKDFISPEFCKE